MKQGVYQEPIPVGKTEFADIMISTVMLPSIVGLYGTSDTRPYETCIFWDGGSSVVARYENPEHAKKGHIEWAKRVVSLITHKTADTRMEWLLRDITA